MSINSVQVDGIVQHPALRYATDGKPEYRFVLEHVDDLPDGRQFTLYVSCCASGKAAERLHEQLDEGMAIQITGGKICYRRRQTQQGELSRMEVFVWAVKPLMTSSSEPRDDVTQVISSPTPPRSIQGNLVSLSPFLTTKSGNGRYQRISKSRGWQVGWKRRRIESGMRGKPKRWWQPRKSYQRPVGR